MQTITTGKRYITKLIIESTPKNNKTTNCHQGAKTLSFTMH